MATGRISSFQLNNFWQHGRQHWQDYLWLIAFVVLPFASYLSLGILIILSLVTWSQARGRLSGWLWRRGYGWLALGLLVSAAIASYPGDAFLQTANFLPYFLMLGALITRYGPDSVTDRLSQLTTLALALVLTSLPFSLLALLEYGIKFPALAARVSDWWIFQWAFEVSFTGHRAHATLGHPNILSAYLVIVVSLGLGLMGAMLSQAKPRPRLFGWVAIATLAGLVGIFCTGSRNGLLVAIFQVLVFSRYLQHRRWIQLAGIGLVTLFVLGAIGLGVGGRHLAIDLITQDPRLGVWQIALRLTRERPVFGWGLGSFSHLYVPDSVPGHEHIHHAHNLWLYLASEAGIPVMLGFCWVVGRALYRAVRAALEPALATEHRALLLSYLLAFGSCMLFGFFDVPLFDARINVLGWLLLASLYLLPPKVRF